MNFFFFFFRLVPILSDSFFQHIFVSLFFFHWADMLIQVILLLLFIWILFWLIARIVFEFYLYFYSFSTFQFYHPHATSLSPGESGNGFEMKRENARWWRQKRTKTRYRKGRKYIFTGVGVCCLGVVITQSITRG